MLFGNNPSGPGRQSCSLQASSMCGDDRNERAAKRPRIDFDEAESSPFINENLTFSPNGISTSGGAFYSPPRPNHEVGSGMVFDRRPQISSFPASWDTFEYFSSAAPAPRYLLGGVAANPSSREENISNESLFPLCNSPLVPNLFQYSRSGLTTEDQYTIFDAAAPGSGSDDLSVGNIALNGSSYGSIGSSTLLYSF